MFTLVSCFHLNRSALYSAQQQNAVEDCFERRSKYKMCSNKHIRFSHCKDGTSFQSASEVHSWGAVDHDTLYHQSFQSPDPSFHSLPATVLTSMWYNHTTMDCLPSSWKTVETRWVNSNLQKPPKRFSPRWVLNHKHDNMALAALLECRSLQQSVILTV